MLELGDVDAHEVFLEDKDRVSWMCIPGLSHSSCHVFFFKMVPKALSYVPKVYHIYFELFLCLNREKIQFIRTEGTPGLVRLSSDADLVMLLR